MANLNLYEFYVNGEKWNSPEETYHISSDKPENALTKLRIIHGKSVYERCYGCYDCENQEIVKDLYSYTMFRERVFRRIGRKYYYYIKKNGKSIWR